MKLKNDLIRTTLRFGLLLFFFAGYSQNKHPLVKYYDGELKLTEEQIDSLIVQILTENNSDYLSALALYQRGILLKNHSEHIAEFRSYSSALNHLLKSDTVDNFLFASIWKNQGAILHNYRLYEKAVNLYQKALEPGYRYSVNQGISIEYNIGFSMIQYDPKKALSLFLDLKNRAIEDPNWQARIYNQLGLLKKRSGQYEDAIAYFEKGINLKTNRRTRANLLQNISDTYYHWQDYLSQERFLLQTLEIPEANRFIALMDLGECYLLQGRNKEALNILTEAEAIYEEQPLKREHIKVFRWLQMLSEDPLFYANKQIEEQAKYIDVMDELKAIMETHAMKNVLLANDSENKRKKDTTLYSSIAMIGGILALLILLTWKIWWYQLKRSIEKNIPRVEN